MLPNIHDRNQSKWTFDLKGKFMTNLELALARNQVHASQQPRIPPEKECWIKQPPDFSYRLYITPSLIRKPHGKPKELKKKKSNISTVHDKLVGIRSRLFDQVTEQEVQPKIITRFPHVGPYEAQLMFVKMGKFKSTKYQDPKPHDYRQRHRRQRGAHSAFIERVEETLSKLWLREACEKQAASKRRKAAESTWQKRLNVAVSTERYSEMEQQVNQKGQQKGRLSQSSSRGRCERGMPKSASLPVYMKPEPLGFFLPTGIAQSVEELTCK
ncbi:hypothetical protein JD844_003099 [Phrynosoma platyrhinos]|uniref:Uncharacterized protein n=1 Tax=Phrynosoma platyrhinos TaxID=52577 RepID=A0ABQ7TDD5_PHRPL|nr:hypothetical protein JD844_003099 [Phrynosoma platyrhinos]